MGIIKRGILGGFSNKVANVVGTSWKGRAVIKSVPLSVANPRTTPQVNQRTKFKSAIQFASPILGQWVKPLFDRFSGDIAGINKWMKLNVENFTNTGTPTYSELVMSEGKMVAPISLTQSWNPTSGTVTLNYLLPTDTTWGQPVEYLFVLIVNGRTGEKHVSAPASFQGEEQEVEIYFSDIAEGDNMHCFAAIKRGDGTQVSNSTYTLYVLV